MLRSTSARGNASRKEAVLPSVKDTLHSHPPAGLVGKLQPNEVNHRTPKRARRSFSSIACNGGLSFCSVCVFICMVLLVTFVGCSFTWSRFHTTDPCLIASLALETLATNKLPQRETPSSSGELLPKIIHQQWKTSHIPSGKLREWRKAWLDLYPEPEFAHSLWTDETMRQLIQEHYHWFLHIYDGYKYDIQRADASRYFILHHVGGLYADLDYQPLINFWDRIPRDRASVIESPYQYNEHHQNSLMASPKGDALWKQVFKGLVETSNKGGTAVFQATGPQFLDKVLRAQPPGSFYTLPCENFHRVPFVQGAGEESPFITRVGHHTLARFFPMKYCGDFSQQQCQFGKHHNAVTYLAETGGLK